MTKLTDAELAEKKIKDKLLVAIDELDYAKNEHDEYNKKFYIENAQRFVKEALAALKAKGVEV